jgi:uncharacterized repeat protein (TIGR03803 family)
MTTSKRIQIDICGLATVLAGFALVLILASAAVLPVQAQTFTVLHPFRGAPDGSVSWSTLVRDPAGNFYGTTSAGGDGYGTIFQINTAGKLKILHRLKANEGGTPYAGLLRDAEGNLYGTTTAYGAYGNGTVFKLDKAGRLKVLYSFKGGTDGADPRAALMRDKKGNLYGTTAMGGEPGCDCGTVFKVDSAGKETVLYAFGAYFGDGEWPLAGVIMDSAGNLYGTTGIGGLHEGNACLEIGCGTVFRVDPNGTETLLYEFTGGTDGAFPLGALIRDQKGNLYGTASNGGDLNCNFGGGCGVVFKLDSNNKETVLYNFETTDGGGIPEAGLVRDAAGNFYGTTYGGGGLCGAYCGVVFKVDRNGKETVLHKFIGNDGGQPIGTVVFDAKGNLYGTTSSYGKYNLGTVYKLTP